MKRILFFLLPAMIGLASPGLLLADAGWDKGFYIKSEDGDFKLKIGGRLQVQEIVQIKQENQPRGTGAVSAIDKFEDSFIIRRARIQTTGTLYKKFDWFIIANTGTASKSATNFDTLWLAGFTYNINDNFNVSGGMVQLPMDRMQENSSAGFFGIEPPLTATQEDGLKDLTIARNTMGMPFDLGLRVDGNITNYFSFALGLANGSGFKKRNFNNELSYGARGVFHVFGRAAPYFEPDLSWSDAPNLSIGFGTGFEDENAADGNVSGVTRLWSWSASGDVALRWAGFSLNTELYYRTLKINGSTAEDTNNNGKLVDVAYYANAGYFILPKKLEFAVMASQLFREGPDNNSNEFGGGLNWYLFSTNTIKFQFDYTNVLDYDDVPGLDNATYHRFRAMFTMLI